MNGELDKSMDKPSFTNWNQQSQIKDRKNDINQAESIPQHMLMSYPR